MLNRTEQDLRELEEKEKQLHKLVKENEHLQKELKVNLDKEKHRQQVELLKQQNRITEERIDYLNAMAADIVAQLTELSTLEDQPEVFSPPPGDKKRPVGNQHALCQSHSLAS